MEDSEEKLLDGHISLFALFGDDQKAFSCEVFVLLDLKKERVMLDLSKEVRPVAWNVQGSEC